jgi:hypothetical protein
MLQQARFELSTEIFRVLEDNRLFFFVREERALRF